MAKNIVGGMSEWSGMLKDLFRQINDGSIGLKEMREFLEHRTKRVVMVFDYQKFYKEIFNRDVNLPKTESREGYWMIAVDKGLTHEEAYKACEKHFKCWKYADNLDKSVTQNDRTSAHGYVVFVKTTVEADEELKNLSASNQLKDKDKGIKGITLLERIVLELFYFWKTGNHLDIENVTLCLGS
ncbi:MAG: Uncharacterized protein Athens071426_660, partial [Parcubacteria group bacterium Athens0714_26]